LIVSEIRKELAVVPGFADAHAELRAIHRAVISSAMFRRSIKNLFSWVLVIVVLLVLFVWLPPGPARPGQTTQFSWLQLGLTYAAMFFSLVPLVQLAKSQIPGRHSWIAVHSTVLAIGVISMPLLPQWCGFLTASIYLLFVFTPNVLSDLSLRRFRAGHLRTAASYARLLPLFHPSRHIRFFSSFLGAEALGSIEQKVAALHALVSRAPPDQFAALNCRILMAQDNWMGVLTQVRSVSDAKLAWLEIRALGELGRIEEMTMTYGIAVAESSLTSSNLVCRLYILAFSGRVDGVQSLLSRQLRSFSSASKAYWTFVACQAAGEHNEEVRRRLEGAVDTANDETFRRAARRHLDTSGVPEEFRKD
jgi:hypothetical protein